MTVEQIDKQIEELKAKKREELLAQRQKNAKKRKLENRVKYIIGGYMLSVSPDYIDKLLTSDNLREQDKKTLQDYKVII